MQQKEASRGLVTVTVAVDTFNDHSVAKVKEEAGKFLTRIKADRSVHLVLDHDFGFWSEKFRFSAAPCIYVFDRRGKWTRFGGDDQDGVDYRALDQLVEVLLDEK
jgi:hypothetical protein